MKKFGMAMLLLISFSSFAENTSGYGAIQEVKSFITHNTITLEENGHSCLENEDYQFWIPKQSPYILTLAISAYVNNKVVSLSYICDEGVENAVITGIRVK